MEKSSEEVCMRFNLPLTGIGRGNVTDKRDWNIEVTQTELIMSYMRQQAVIASSALSISITVSEQTTTMQTA